MCKIIKSQEDEDTYFVGDNYQVTLIENMWCVLKDWSILHPIAQFPSEQSDHSEHIAIDYAVMLNKLKCAECQAATAAGR